MSPAPTEEANTAIQIPAGAWEYLGWAVKGFITVALGWVVVLWNDVQGIKRWRAGVEAQASMRDQQRGEILEIVKEIRDDVKDQGQRIAHLEGFHESETR
jgi:hypothetical protein